MTYSLIVGGVTFKGDSKGDNMCKIDCRLQGESPKAFHPLKRIFIAQKSKKSHHRVITEKNAFV